jgi:protease-4
MPEPSVGLNDIIENLKKAKDDKNIRGIYLEISNPIAGFATLEEVRNALLDFKSSGKFIYAYSEVYSQKAYYLATTANKLYLNPQGGMEIKGLSSQIMFFKKMLDKLDMEVQIFRHGKFKSAIEPFMLDKMSDANRTQVETYLGSLVEPHGGWELLKTEKLRRKKLMIWQTTYPLEVPKMLLNTN